MRKWQIIYSQGQKQFKAMKIVLSIQNQFQTRGCHYTRTSRGVQEIFLHLRLFNNSKKQRANYLFADLSGEEIQAHIANVGSLTKQMPFEVGRLINGNS